MAGVKEAARRSATAPVPAITIFRIMTRYLAHESGEIGAGTSSLAVIHAPAAGRTQGSAMTEERRKGVGRF
jgi:hypothetical protein